MNCLRGLYPAEEFILGESATGPFILVTIELSEVFGEFLLKCSLMKSSQTVSYVRMAVISSGCCRLN